MSYDIMNYTVDEGPMLRRVLVDLNPLKDKIEILYDQYIHSAKSHFELVTSEDFSQRKFFDILYYTMGLYEEETFIQYLRWSMVDSDLVEDYLQDAARTIEDEFIELYGVGYRWLGEMAFYQISKIRDPMFVIFIDRNDYRINRPEGEGVSFPWFLYGLRAMRDRYRGDEYGY